MKQGSPFPRSSPFRSLPGLARRLLAPVPALAIGLLFAGAPAASAQDLAALPTIAPGEVSRWDEADWEVHGSAWLDALRQRAVDAGFDADQVAKATLDSVVDATFVHALVGSVEVRIPVEALEDSSWSDRALDSLAALCELQVTWGEWIDDEDDEALEDRRKRIAALGKTLRKTRGSQVRSLDLGPGQDLLLALGIDEELLGDGTPQPVEGSMQQQDGGLAPLAPDAVRVVLMHERGPFLQYVGAAGVSFPYLREFFWKPDVEQWLSIDHDETRVLSLSFSDPGSRTSQGTPMDERNPQALEEHVTLMAARGLMAFDFGAGLEPMLAGGLATELVIELYGEADTYTDGDVAARETEARSVFIPGGNPNGGILPVVKADSRWRADLGRDHFVEPLRSSQKAGGKEASRKQGKLVNFQLQDESERKTFLLQAPFLGPGASEEPPPAAFSNDHLGLLRAYRTAFLHWLRTNGGKGKKDSAAKFKQLLGELAVADNSEGTAAVLEAVYGLPLSVPDLEEEDSLEGEFLNWLKKQ